MDKLDTFGSNSQLALLLALSRLKPEDLSEHERFRLKEIGIQLTLVEDAWNFIQEDLMQIISGNETLYNFYQDELIKLEGVEGGIPSELLPTEVELMQELADTEKQLQAESEFRGHFEGNPKERDVFTNLCIHAFQEPEKTTELNFLKRVRQFLHRKKD